MNQRHMQQVNENDKGLKSGVYSNHYLVYNRKSTDEPENQKNSLQYQKSENLRFALKQKLPVADISLQGFCTDGIISEKHSAFKEDTELIIGNNGLVQYRIERPKFHKLIHVLNNKYFKGVIVLCWDRISRNKGDEAVIRKLMKSGIDFQFVLASYDKSSSGALHMDIDGMFAEHHSRVTSEKVKINVRSQRAKGLCTYKAPVGYLNTGTIEEKPIDQKRAPLIKRMFELYATGNWSLASIAQWATENGFTLAPKRRKRTKEEMESEEGSDKLVEIKAIERIPTYTSIQRILTNPFYTGKIIGNEGVYTQSQSHKAIISEKLFYEVQAELKRKKVCVKYLNRLDHPFRGLIRCGGCQRLYTPYIQKEILYFGSKCHSSCSNPCKSFNIDFVITKIGEIIQGIPLTESEVKQLDDIVSTKLAVFETNRLNNLDSLENKKKKLREDLSYLRSNKLNLLKTGVYTPDEMMQEEDKLNRQIINFQQEEQDSDEAMEETVKQVVKLSELLKTLKHQYVFGDLYEKEEIVKLLFSELHISEKTLGYQCKKGIHLFENRFITSCALNDWLSELPTYNTCFKECIKQIEAYSVKINN